MTYSSTSTTSIAQGMQQISDNQTCSDSTVLGDKSTAAETISPLEDEVLSVLLGRELYGLQICRAFEEASDGRRRISAGTLYPILARLEKKGLVTSRMATRPTDSKGGAKRKYFQITRRGSLALADAERFRNHLAAWQPVNA
jgi:PadR family transcriptional regulator, regulatory protein PadR